MADGQQRYHVVVVSKYLDGPAHIRAIRAYAVADHQQANRCVSRTYDEHTRAQAEADRLNSQQE